MRKVVIVLAIVIAVLCGGIGLTGYRAWTTGKDLLDAGITKRQFDAQKAGAPETAVRAALPDPIDPMPDEDVYGDDPGRAGMPDGASCVYYTLKPIEASGPDLWRFCFAGGLLVQKKALTLPE
ncbi:hypothetical protein [Actinoplanes palleronii]|uniref:Uncharacterized protein n=1 Tax=Actinoplanes palleronii TaxID=113570 RepID=A0ABQ4BT78_9ACTN|nr:hypothetical protein [Actinoplanes palleronii]GIE73879.1 hypothetical protein Apa02nite_099870 [Actinoplanes palleronii]